MYSKENDCRKVFDTSSQLEKEIIKEYGFIVSCPSIITFFSQSQRRTWWRNKTDIKKRKRGKNETNYARR